MPYTPEAESVSVELDRFIYKRIHERIAELQCRMQRLEDEIKPLRAEYEAARRSEERQSD